MTPNDKKISKIKKPIITEVKDNTLVTIYCADGPLKGSTHSSVIRRRKVHIPIPTNPFYKTACYLVTGTLTPLNERIAVFSHCQRRDG